MTYEQLHREVCEIANGLKKFGVNKGDRVGIYLPMIPEAAIAMLACVRIGAIHSVEFGGFKGVVHATGGYNLYTHITTQWAFDLQDTDIFWCTADVGWITGHSYIVYGPLIFF